VVWKGAERHECTKVWREVNEGVGTMVRGERSFERCWSLLMAYERRRREEKRLAKKKMRERRDHKRHWWQLSIHWGEERVQEWCWWHGKRSVQEWHWWNGKGPGGALVVQDDVAEHQWWQGRVQEDIETAEHCWWQRRVQKRVQEQCSWNKKGPGGALMVREDVAKYC